jgi:hypothetical protein
MLAAHVQRHVEESGVGRGLALPTPGVGGGEAVATAGAEAGEEFADGAGAQAQVAGDRVGGVALRGTFPDELALREGHRTRHGKPPCGNRGKKRKRG